MAVPSVRPAADDLDFEAVTLFETDYTRITAIAETVLIGDANDDGVVDAADYIALKTNIGQATGAVLASGDFDEDGDVDWDDLQLLQDHYGETSAGGAVPEPATLGLLAIGAMAARRRRS